MNLARSDRTGGAREHTATPVLHVIRDDVSSVTKNAPPNFSTGLKLATFCTVELLARMLELPEDK